MFGYATVLLSVSEWFFFYSKNVAVGGLAWSRRHFFLCSCIVSSIFLPYLTVCVYTSSIYFIRFCWIFRFSIQCMGFLDVSGALFSLMLFCRNFLYLSLLLFSSFSFSPFARAILLSFYVFFILFLVPLNSIETMRTNTRKATKKMKFLQFKNM